MNWWQLVPTERRRDHHVAVAPSILSADFTRLSEEIARVEKAGADMLHLDVMDGHFVPNITFGPFIVDAIRRVATIPLDAHLMIENPDQYVERFVHCGAGIVTIHAETCKDIQRDLELIRTAGAKRGLSINPDTAFDTIHGFMKNVDMLLIMSVFPGFGGQSFIDGALDKISQAKAFRDEQGLSYAIQVDGGINSATAKPVREAGADIIVAGTAVFKTPDYKEAILGLRGAADRV
ncbi:MAG: ribulose-phosphate 3-epimerase [Candidatus Latescibacterota bacterium]